jgi:hypothetical protein
VASINVSGGGGTSYILIIGAIIAIVGLIYFIRKNPNFLSNLMGGGGSKIGAVAETKPGPNVFTVVGPIASTAASGNGGPSCRDNQEFDCSKCNRESTSSCLFL